MLVQCSSDIARLREDLPAVLKCDEPGKCSSEVQELQLYAAALLARQMMSLAMHTALSSKCSAEVQELRLCTALLASHKMDSAVLISGLH